MVNNNVALRPFADPLLDLKENKSTLFLGTAPNKENQPQISQEVLNKIRSQIIHLNLSANGPLKTLEKPIIIERTAKPPFWTSLKSVFNRLQKKDLEQIVKIVIHIVFAIFLGFVTKYLTTSALKNYADMKAGNLFWYRKDDYDFQFPIRAYSMTDFLTEDLWPLVSFSFLTVVSTYVCYEEIIKFKNSMNPLIQEIKKAYNDPFLITQKIKLIPSPIAGREKNLSNVRDGDAYIDPVSKEEIFPNDLSKSVLILLGDQVLTIDSLLKTLILSDLDPYTNRLKHPLEERLLTVEEQESVLEQLAAFYCIDDKEQLLNCWKLPDDFDTRVDQYLRSQKGPINQIPPEQISDFAIAAKIDVSIDIRRENFFKLIPADCRPPCLDLSPRVSADDAVIELF